MADLEYDKRQLDNLINKVNKRADTIKQRLGQESTEYQHYMKVFTTAVNGSGRIDNTSLYRKTDSGDIVLTRSLSRWQKFADEYGAKKVNEFLNSLSRLETYVEAEERIKKQYKERVKKRPAKQEEPETTVKQMAEYIRTENEKITRYFQLLYGMSKSEDTQIAIEARNLLYLSKYQGSKTEKDSLVSLVTEFVETNKTGKSKMSETELKEIEHKRKARTKAIDIMQGRLHYYKTEEREHGLTSDEHRKVDEINSLIDMLKNTIISEIDIPTVTSMVNEVIR